jgi:TolB-like protein/Tfp pilus assembly protein PilF
MTAETGHIYEFGKFRFDVVKRELRRGGDLVSLTPKVLDTLRVLIQNPGQTVTKDELMEEIWADSFVEESGLMRNISVLRKALGEQDGAVPFIVTVPRQGYRFLPDVRMVGDDGAGGFTVSERRRTRIVVEEHEVAGDHQALAVLPFKVLGGETVDAYFGLGMADALITKLSNIRGLRVRPTSSIVKYGSDSHDPLRAARELDVNSMIEGSIWQLGKRLRITVQLVSVADGASLWAEKFEDTSTDIFDIQDSISEKVAAALELRLSSGERKQLAKRGTENLEAYRLYAKALFHLHKFTPQNAETAMSLLEEAIRLDPGYALAHSCLLGCLLQKASFGVLDLSSIAERARKIAKKTMDLDPMLPEAHYGNASVSLYFDWDLAAAERSFKHAVQLSPNDANASKHYGMYLFIAGRFDEAVSQAKFTRELDPVTPGTTTHVGLVHYYARRFEESIGWHRIALEMDPHFVYSQIGLAWSLVKIGAFPEALAAVALVDDAAKNEPNVMAARGYTAAAAGDIKAAKKELNNLLDLSKRSVVSATDIAAIYAELGKTDEALTWLDKAVTERALWLVYLKVNPRFDKLRSDPRFEKILHRIFGS